MDEDMHRPRKAARRIQLGRFVVSVDGQAKAGFSERVEADAMAEKIRQAYSRVAVTVADMSAEESVTP